MQNVVCLIVAINKYASPHIPALDGCVNDAQLIQKYLIDIFGLSPRRTFTLFDDEATRDNIIVHFQQKLIENSTISFGDPIVFFFAGHGSRITAPEGWDTPDGKIETICPYDQDMNRPGQGTLTPGIPDITLHILFQQLVKAKGSNVTAIYDCCHSGGISRGIGAGLRPRGAFEVMDAPLGTIDDAIHYKYSSLQSSKTDPFRLSRRGSVIDYTLLSACGLHEQAMELVTKGPAHGLFTYSLVKYLRKYGHQTTPQDLLKLISRSKHMRAQTPQSEGSGRHRMMFGVQPGRPKRTRSASLPVHNGAMVVYCDSSFESREEELRDSIDFWDECSVTSKVENAHVVIAAKGEGITLRHNEGFFVRYGLGEIEISCSTMSELASALLGIARFRRHLRHAGEGTWLHDVSVARDDSLLLLEMFPLVVGQSFLTPKKDNLLVENVAQITVDETVLSSPFGFKITNRCESRMHIYLICFDLSGYMIQVFYEDSQPVEPGASITVGYGPGGGDPVFFHLQQGLEAETTFFKVLASREWLDVALLQQGSLLNDGRMLNMASPCHDYNFCATTLGAVTIVRS